MPNTTFYNDIMMKNVNHIVPQLIHSIHFESSILLILRDLFIMSLDLTLRLHHATLKLKWIKPNLPRQNVNTHKTELGHSAHIN